MLTYYPLAYKPGWRFLERKIKDRTYIANEVQSRQITLQTIGENKNKQT